MSDQGSQAPIEAVYTERNQAIAVLVKLALRLGYQCMYFAGNDPEWPVVFIDLPGNGQVSWHVHHSELQEYFPPSVKYFEFNPWDGHTNEQKAMRLMREASQPDRSTSAE